MSIKAPAALWGVVLLGVVVAAELSGESRAFVASGPALLVVVAGWIAKAREVRRRAQQAGEPETYHTMMRETQPTPPGFWRAFWLG